MNKIPCAVCGKTKDAKGLEHECLECGNLYSTVAAVTAHQAKRKHYGGHLLLNLLPGGSTGERAVRARRVDYVKLAAGNESESESDDELFADTDEFGMTLMQEAVSALEAEISSVDDVGVTYPDSDDGEDEEPNSIGGLT